jgi:aminoglycoside phosphotransferase (APT) family kinase protein
VDVADGLLTLLRQRLDRADLLYAEAPRRLSGGFYTENWVFTLTGAPDGWPSRLVLRLFPGPGPNELAEREAAVQNVLVAQGYPTPRVLMWDESTDAFGRSFLIMEFLAGRPLMSDVGVGQLVRSAASFIVSLPRVLSETQARLHRMDVTPLVDALGARRAGVDRWIDSLNEFVAASATDWSEPLAWLADNRPKPAEPDVICHGDMWPGNLLGHKRRVVGVLDWSVCTVAEPALDVGFTSVLVTLAPLALPPPAERFVLWVTPKLTRRYVSAYMALNEVDLTNQPWYEALRCLIELTGVVNYRTARAEGRALDTPRPAWDPVSERVVDYFRARTGVSIPLPPPATTPGGSGGG